MRQICSCGQEYEGVAKRCNACRFPDAPTSRKPGGRKRETWTVIPGFEARYTMNTHGTVKDMIKDHNVSPFRRARGYEIALYSDGVRRLWSLPRLFLGAWIGAAPSPKHIALCQSDNIYDIRLENWAWGLKQGDTHHRSILSEQDVRQIKSLLMSNQTLTYQELANQFHVSAKTIGNIMSGHSWGNVS